MLAAGATGIEAAWDPTTRFLSLDCDDRADLSGASAERILAGVKTLLPGGPVRILVRARRASHATLLWQLAWTEFLRAHRQRVRLAVYDVPPALRGIVRSVAWSTGGAVAAFGAESEARAWLTAFSPS